MNKTKRNRKLNAQKAVPSKFNWYIASSYISSFLIIPGHKYVLVVRVSTHSQKGHLKEQEVFLRREVESRGGIVADAKDYIGPGCDIAWLGEVAQIAKSHDAVMLAESTARFVRDPSYNPQHNDLQQASEEQFKQLSSLVDGVKLMTFLSPNALPREIRGHEAKRGQRMKNNKGGRPKNKKPGYKKKIRMKKLKEVLKLHLQGKSYREIERITSVKKSTNRDWIMKYG